MGRHLDRTLGYLRRALRTAHQIVFAFLLLSLPVAACFWDTDTIDTELRGIPKASVLATGRWFRHGPEYYRSRVTKLEGEKLGLAGCDDLAVAYSHLGFHQKALEAIDRKAALLAATPDREHQYRYHANRGTILAHSGHFQEAVSELDLALKINPDAHFGRERYQRDLIRYLAATNSDPKLWTEHNFLSWSGYSVMGVPFVIGNPSFRGPGRFELEGSWEEAFEGVSGMLRFGGLEGPELYRCLGDLSLANHHLNLAWLFYLKAIEKNHPASEAIEASVLSIEEHWVEAGFRGRPSREDFRLSQESAKQWLTAFHAAEEAALKAGEDPAEPEVLEKLVRSADKEVPPHDSFDSASTIPMATIAIVSLLVGFTAVRRRRKRTR